MAGHDADYGARLDPARYEPNPKRRIDDGHLLLGDAEVPVVDAVAALFRMIATEARRVTGGDVDEVVLAHPAGWGTHRKAILRAAAGLGPVTMVAEPVAAAGYFAVAPGRGIRRSRRRRRRRPRRRDRRVGGPPGSRCDGGAGPMAFVLAAGLNAFEGSSTRWRCVPWRCGPRVVRCSGCSPVVPVRQEPHL